ncbi:MAG TPA: LysM peptidoglycan-binding domain-containing protein [Dehalococcoidia bacterium]|nr:LysM peptidoglycan-binding domain-containing protein [Dehalococcoidia bacterium]
MTSFQPLQPPDAVAPCPFLAGGARGQEDAAPPPRSTPSAANVCLAQGDALPVSLQHQIVFCLGGRATVCSRYRAAAAPMAAVAPPARPIAQPAAAAREPGRLAPRLAIAALALATGVGVVAAVMAVGNPFDAEPAPSGPATAATVAPTVTVSATAAAVSGTPFPTATPAPTATAPPTPTAMARPTATPARYTVQSGDSLTRLAARFGISVAQLAAANGLPADARLQIGQTLTIPPPGAASPTPP